MAEWGRDKQLVLSVLACQWVLVVFGRENTYEGIRVFVRRKGGERKGKKGRTCTMATRRRTPRKPTAIEAAAMTAGPLRNLTAIEKAAIEFPHAMILGCNAMNSPTSHTPPTQTHSLFSQAEQKSPQVNESLPKLNMAIPRPASESMEMDLAMMAGMLTFHLPVRNR